MFGARVRLRGRHADLEVGNGSPLDARIPAERVADRRVVAPASGTADVKSLGERRVLEDGDPHLAEKFADVERTVSCRDGVAGIQARLLQRIELAARTLLAVLEAARYAERTGRQHHRFTGDGRAGQLLRDGRNQHARRYHVLGRLRRDRVVAEDADRHATLDARVGIAADRVCGAAVVVDVVDVGNRLQRIAEVQHVDLSAAHLRFLGLAVGRVGLVLPAAGDQALHPGHHAEGVAVGGVAAIADLVQPPREAVHQRAILVALGEQAVDALRDHRVLQQLAVDQEFGRDHAGGGIDAVDRIGRIERERLEVGLGVGRGVGRFEEGAVVRQELVVGRRRQQVALGRDGQPAIVLAIEAGGADAVARRPVGRPRNDVALRVEGARCGADARVDEDPPLRREA